MNPAEELMGLGFRPQGLGFLGFRLLCRQGSMAWVRLQKLWVLILGQYPYSNSHLPIISCLRFGLKALNVVLDLFVPGFEGGCQSDMNRVPLNITYGEPPRLPGL